MQDWPYCSFAEQFTFYLPVLILSHYVYNAFQGKKVS